MHVTIFNLTAHTNKPGRNIFVDGTEFCIITDIVTHCTFEIVLTYTVAFGLFSNLRSGEEGLSIVGQTVAGNSPAKGSIMTKTDLLSMINWPFNCHGKNRSFCLMHFCDGRQSRWTTLTMLSLIKKQNKHSKDIYNTF